VSKEAARRYRATDKGRATEARYRATPAARAGAVRRARAYYKRNPAARVRASVLSRWPGFEAFLLDQLGLCAVCSRPMGPKPTDCHVDHDHTTSRIRGLLCGHCNAVLGYARDSVEVLLSAALYIERTKP